MKIELADDPLFASAPDRVRHREVIVPVLKAVIKQRPRDEWLARFDEGGVPCGAIRSVAEVCESEVLRARCMIAEMQHQGAGTVEGIKSAIELSETPLDGYSVPPKLGEHTRRVLTEILGYTAAEADTLAGEGVV